MKRDLIADILSVFEQFRMPELEIDQYKQIGRSILAEKIAMQIAKNQELSFVMLGLPFKSTNVRDKVLGEKPDMAELETMKQFARFNEQIKSVYKPGVRVKVVSDGFVFNDLLEVEDKTVWTYKEICEEMIKNTGASVDIYDLTDFYGKSNSLDSMRKGVMGHFGITEDELQHNILFDADVNMLYKGMIRFMGEELRMKNYSSNNQLHVAAKKLARNMMFRNEAYSNLVKMEFSEDIRLSMHPSINNGAKYSFQMIQGEDVKHSAWHSVLVLNTDGSVKGTMHKSTAIELGFELVKKQEQDFYFVNIKNL